MFNVLDMKEKEISDTKSVVYHGFRIDVPKWTKYIVSSKDGDLFAIGSFMISGNEVEPVFDERDEIWDCYSDFEPLPYTISFTGNIKESLTRVV